MPLLMDRPLRPRVKRWNKQEFKALVELGAFRSQNVYLFRGELIEMPPMGAPHAQCLMKISNWLYATFRPQWEVRIQMPFDAPGDSMPEPDAAVLAVQDALHMPHPEKAALLIEVSDTSVEIDHEKAFEYAAAGVPEYWVVDLKAGQIHVYCAPVETNRGKPGSRYSEHSILEADQMISARFLSADVSVKVVDLLP